MKSINKVKTGDLITIDDNTSRYNGRQFTVVDVRDCAEHVQHITTIEGAEFMHKQVKINKLKKTRFIAFYEINGIDPLVRFETRVQLENWLITARNNPAIKFDSITVFEVKHEYSVKTSVELSTVKSN